MTETPEEMYKRFEEYWNDIASPETTHKINRATWKLINYYRNQVQTLAKEIIAIATEAHVNIGYVGHPNESDDIRRESLKRIFLHCDKALDATKDKWGE